MDLELTKECNQPLWENVTLTEQHTVVFKGSGTLSLNLHGTPIASMNTANPSYTVQVPGDYVFAMPDSCASASIFITPVFAVITAALEEGAGTAGNTIQPVKYLPGGVAPCVSGWLMLSPSGSGSGITTVLTDLAGSNLDLALNPLVP